MDNVLPELLLHIFDLAIHTPHDQGPSFPPRTPVPSQATKNDSPTCSWIIRDIQYPDFPSGITSHETNPCTPLNLSHVCKQWRSLAFAESNLWATIYVTNGKEGFQDLLKLWIGLSGSRHLKIVFRDGRDNIPADGKGVVAMLGLAAAHSRRWRSFKVRLRYIRIAAEGLHDALKHINTPNLQELAFSFHAHLPEGFAMAYQNFYVTFMERWAPLLRSPKLQEIQMWDIMDYNAGFLSSIPFSRLTDISLPMVSIRGESKFIPKLSRCANLHTLSVSLNLCEKLSSELYGVSIPSLRSLVVIGFSTAHVNAFIQVFHLPALQHLAIHSPTTKNIKFMDALRHWNARLQALELRAERRPDPYLTSTDLLSDPALATLSHLRIGDAAGAHIFQLLTMAEGQSHLPRLQHIHIESLRLNGDYEAPANMALSWSRSKDRPLVIGAEFVDEDDMLRAIELWDQFPKEDLRTVDRKFRWIDPGKRWLDREFMIRDFSMIQGWQ